MTSAPVHWGLVEKEMELQGVLPPSLALPLLRNPHPGWLSFPYHLSPVQAAWVTALWQAAIPRHELINVLHQSGRLPDVVDCYARTVRQCYPVADAAVLSTAGTRGKLSFLGNMGALAGALRKARAKGDSIFGSLKDLSPNKVQAARDGSGKRLPAALQVGWQAAVEAVSCAACSTRLC